MLNKAKNLLESEFWKVYSLYCDGLEDYLALTRYIKLKDFDLLTTDEKNTINKIIDRESEQNKGEKIG